MSFIVMPIIQKESNKTLLSVVVPNVGIKVTGKKSREKKSQIWVGKKSQEKSHKYIFFSTFRLEIFIIICFITNIFKIFLFGLMFYALTINIFSHAWMELMLTEDKNSSIGAY